MSFVATAVIGGAVIGGLATSKASKTAAGAANKANESLDARYAQMRADQYPFITAGTDAQARLSDFLGTSGRTDTEGYGKLLQPFTPADFLANKDPGYGFEMQQGTQAVRNAAASGSGSLSGAALKDVASFSQGLARTGYQAAYDRWNTNMNNTFARLANVASLGQNAAAQTGSQGVAIGQQQAANTTAAGNASAAAWANMGNIGADALTNYALLRKIQPTPQVQP